MKRQIALWAAVLAAIPGSFVRAQVSSFDVLKLGQFDPAASPTSENYSDGWGYTRINGTKLALIGTVPLAPNFVAGVRIADVTNPSAPVELPTFIQGPSRRVDVKTYLNYAYIVFNLGAGAPGIVIVDLEPNPPVIVNPGYSSSDFKIGHSLWVDGGYLYVFGAEVNLGEPTARTLILSLANPVNPVEVGRFTDFYLHDGVVRNNRIYALAERINDNCAAIIDVTNKTNPVLLTKFGWPSLTPHSGDLSADGNSWLTTSESGPTALNPFAGRLRIFDIRDINNIRPVSVYTANPIQTVHDVYVVGNLAHVAHNREGYRLVDIANPEAPVEIGHYDPSSQTGPQGTWGTYPFDASGNVYVFDRENGALILRYQATRGAAEGTVTEAGTGTTIPGATVSYLSGGSSMSSSLGFYKLYGSPGSQTLIVGAFGFQTASIPVNLVAGSSVTLPVQLSRAPGSSLAGTIRNAITSQPVSNVTVLLEGTPLTAVTNASGQYTFPHVPNATYLLKTSLVGFRPESQFVTVNGSPVQVDLYAWPSSSALTFTFESGSQGWGADPNDNATAGRWLRADPIPNALGVVQTGDDHTPGSDVFCWFTGNALSATDRVGTEAVANGTTTLLSPVMNLTGLNNPHISYWRWYFNGEGTTSNSEPFVIEISNDGGNQWTPVETVGSTSNGWVNVDFKVSTKIAVTSQMRMRFIARDLGLQGGVEAPVEAALDDFMIYEECPGTGSVLTSSMTAWASEASDPSSMALHFRFSTTLPACQFAARYRPKGTSAWIYRTCTLPSSSCLFFLDPGNTYEVIALFSPCAGTKFEWQAQTKGCGGWSAWSSSKFFTAYCLTGLSTKDPDTEPIPDVPGEFRVTHDVLSGGAGVQFSVDVPNSDHLELIVLDISGRLVATVVESDVSAERRSFHWDGRNGGGVYVPSGLYFYRARLGSKRLAGKIHLVR